MTFETNSVGRECIRAGPLNQLIIHLTSPSETATDALAGQSIQSRPSLLNVRARLTNGQPPHDGHAQPSGSEFYGTFMMTLQTFTDPVTFVEKLIERYRGFWVYTARYGAGVRDGRRVGGWVGRWALRSRVVEHNGAPPLPSLRTRPRPHAVPRTRSTPTSPFLFIQLPLFLYSRTLRMRVLARFDVPPCPPDMDENEYNDDIFRPIRMRVCNVLYDAFEPRGPRCRPPHSAGRRAVVDAMQGVRACMRGHAACRKQWIVQRYDQDLVANPTLVNDVIAFIEGPVARESEYLSRNLRQCLQLYVRASTVNLTSFPSIALIARPGRARNIHECRSRASASSTTATLQPAVPSRSRRSAYAL